MQAAMNGIGWNWAGAPMNEINWHWAVHCENDMINLSNEAHDDLIEQKLLSIQCYEIWNKQNE